MPARIRCLFGVAAALSLAAALSACESYPPGRIPAGPYGGCPAGYHPGPYHHWCFPN